MSTQIPQEPFNLQMPKEMWAIITDYGGEEVTDVRRLIDLFNTSAYDPNVWEREAARLNIDLSSKNITPTSNTANTAASDVSLKIASAESTKSFAGSAAATPAVTSATPAIDTTKPEVVSTSTIVSAASTTASVASSSVVAPSNADRAADSVLRYYYEKDIFEAIIQVSPPARLEASRLDDPLKKHDAIMEMLKLDKNIGAIAELFCRLIRKHEEYPNLRIRDAVVFLIKHGLIDDVNASDKKIAPYESSLKTIYDYIPWIVKNIKNPEDSQVIIDALIKECKGFSADEALAKLLAIQDLTDDQQPNFYAAMHKILEIRPPGLADYENVLLNLKKCIDDKNKLMSDAKNMDEKQFSSLSNAIRKHIQLIGLFILNDPNIQMHRPHIEKSLKEIKIDIFDLNTINKSLSMCDESMKSQDFHRALLEGIQAYEREQNHTVLDKRVLQLTDPLQMQQSLGRSLVKLAQTRGYVELRKIIEILESRVEDTGPPNEDDDATFERVRKNALISDVVVYLSEIRSILASTQSPSQIKAFEKFMHEVGRYDIKPSDPYSYDPDDPYS